MLSFKESTEDEMLEGAFVHIQHVPHFAHISKSIVVLGTESKLAQVAEFRYTLGVEMPSTVRIYIKWVS